MSDLSHVEAQSLLVSIEEAGRLLCVSRSSIYSLIRTGRLVPIKLGKSTRFRRVDIEALADRGA